MVQRRDARRGFGHLKPALAVLLASLAPMVAPIAVAQSANQSQAVSGAPTTPISRESLGRLPIRFEPNEGQTDPSVDYVARVGGSIVFLNRSGAVLSVERPKMEVDEESGVPKAAADGSTVREAVFMNLVGSKANPKVEALDELPGVTNYLTASGSSGTQTGVPGYGRIRYKDVYPGIDMVYRDGPDGLAYDFEVDPKADPNRITLAFKGAGASVGSEGILRLNGANGELRQSKPETFQDTSTGRRSVDSGFTSDPNGLIRFHVGNYDRSKKLIIDPTLAWSTFLGEGSGGGEAASAVAADGTGVYVAGTASSYDFPTTPGAFQPTDGGSRDAFVTKVALDGSSLVYSTYLGGGGDDDASSVALDGSGRAVVAGNTGSPDFPTTPGAFSSNTTGNDGITLANSNIYRSASPVFSPTDVGKSLISDSLGGTIIAFLTPTAVRIDGHATANAAGLSFLVGPQGNFGFVTKLSADGSSLEYSTRLGGGAGDAVRSIVLDGSGSAYVAGRAASANFPTTTGAFDANRTFSDGVATSSSTTYTSASASFSLADTNRYITGPNIPDGTTISSITDASTVELSASATASDSGLTFTLGNHSGGSGFLSRLSADGSDLLYSTYLAGTGGAEVNGVTLAGGVPVVAGSGGGDFPVNPVPGVYQPTEAGGGDVIVTKIDITAVGNGTGVVSPSNPGLVFSTFIGGTGGESARAVASDAAGNVYVTGYTNSLDFPITPGAPDTVCDGSPSFCSTNAFVAKLGSNGATLGYATYLGGFGTSEGLALYVDASSSAHVAGYTGSTDFLTVNPLKFNAGGSDGFVSTVDPTGTSLTFSTYLGGTSEDSIRALAPDGAGGTYVVGMTNSIDMSTTHSAFDQVGSGVNSGFVSHLAAGASPPAIQSVSPPGGPPGTPVTITGAGFTGATAVRFGGRSADSFTVVSDTEITLVTPEGGNEVTITGPAGTTLFPGVFKYGTGIFEPTGFCSTTCGGVSTLLPNGKVLTMGSGGVSNIYDPASGTWSVTGTCTSCNMDSFVAASSLVLLNTGKVLYAGGRTGGASTAPSSNTAFLYDPVVGTWSPTATTMVNSHLGHTTTLLPDGRVLVAGGCAQNRNCGPTGGNGNAASLKAEIYDPVANTWTATGDLLQARARHTAVLLKTATGNCGTDCGKVLVAGGNNNGGALRHDSMELFDPATGTWTSTSPMRDRRYFHRAVQLDDGTVLQVGGYLSINTSDEYKPSVRSTVSPPATMGFATGLSNQLSMLPSGKVLSIAGTQTQLFYRRTFVPNPANASPGSWDSAVAPPWFNHGEGTSVTLPSGPLSACGTNCGKVLVAGGQPGFTDLTTAELYTFPPEMASATPDNGPGEGGTVVTITGTGLASVDRVTFGGVEGTNIVHDPGSPDTSLTVVSPRHSAGGTSIFTYSAGGRSGSDLGYTYNSDAPGPAVADFDGDFDSDVAVYRPSSGTWFVKDGVSPTYGGSDFVPVPADYDGDGTTDVAVYRPSDGSWFVKDGISAVLGDPNDIPVPGDYDGDGLTDIAVYRPSDGSWLVKDAPTVVWGAVGDIPVPGDYNNDEVTDIAVYRPSDGTWYIKDGTSAVWGGTGFFPVPGDYDANGTTDIAVYRPADGSWFVKDGISAVWGAPDDIPVPGDFDGNGTADIAIYRPSDGTWYVREGISAVWGATGDIPLVLPFALYDALVP